MSCRELSDLQLWGYLDRELAEDEQHQVEAHLTACTYCVARVETMRRRPLPLGEQRFISPPPDFQRRVMARIAVEAQPAWRLTERSWLAVLVTARRLTAVAAGALLLALGSAVVVGAVLAVPAVEAAIPRAGSPLANNMLLAMGRVLLPLGSFFRDWGWLVVLTGMLATVMVLGAQALVAPLRARG